MKGYSAFCKVSVLLEPNHQTALCHIRDTHRGGGGFLPLCKDDLAELELILLNALLQVFLAPLILSGLNFTNLMQYSLSK